MRKQQRRGLSRLLGTTGGTIGAGQKRGQAFPAGRVRLAMQSFDGQVGRLGVPYTDTAA